MIDAKQKLSLQVYPDQVYARTYEGENGKTDTVSALLVLDGGATLAHADGEIALRGKGEIIYTIA